MLSSRVCQRVQLPLWSVSRWTRLVRCGSRHLRIALFAGCLIVAPAALVDSANAAGLFDAISAIFGGDPEPPRFDYRSPTQDFEPLRSIVRRRTSPKPGKTIVRDTPPKETAPVNAAALNPATNPNWYLEDPTLRLGDIVVLKGEVLVFEGGRLPYTRADFSSLSESRLSKSDRDKLAAMARLSQTARSTNVANATR